MQLFSIVRTSLGEESAESMVIVGSFALFGEITIGLDVLLALMAPAFITIVSSHLNAVLEAVELWYLN
jgi:hypothetical protein